MRHFAILFGALGLAACLGPAPPPPPLPAELQGHADCASTVFPADPAVSAGTFDHLGGVYRLGRESVTVSRSGSRFLVHRVLYGVREIRPDAPGGTSFQDGCGNRYLFTLPWLTIGETGGATTRWRRQNY